MSTKNKKISKKKIVDKISLVSQILLEALDNAFDTFQFIFDHRQFVAKEFQTNRQVVYNTVSRLKKAGYLQEVEEKGEKYYRTTLKGKAKILRFLKIDKKWDKKWRIVVFDIPETKKEMRNFFRGKLRDVGFRKLQESVWICPYDIADIVEELIELCQAEEYVHYLLVEEIDNRDVLLKLFKLSDKK